jgi:hypothetical protein
MKKAPGQMFALAFGLLGTVFLAVADDAGLLQIRAVPDYASHQIRDNLAIAAEPYEAGSKVKVAFGTVDPYAHGILPVLLVIANDSDSILQLDKLRVQFVDSTRQAYDPVSADDVTRNGPRGRWGTFPGPMSWPWPRGNPRSPSDGWQIGAREFKASFVSPRASASGFFYFLTGSRQDPIPGATLYVTGLVDGRSAKDLMYFEIDLEPYNVQRRQQTAHITAQPAEASRFRMIQSR